MIKNEALELEIPQDNVTEPVSKANDKLTEYKKSAKEQTQSIASALNSTKVAGSAAKKARDKIKEVLDKLLALLKEIDNVGTVNTTRLDELENQLFNRTKTINEVDEEVGSVEKTRVVIREKIKEYTIDLEKLRAAKNVLEERYSQLPKVCPRVTPTPEQRRFL